MKKCIVLKVAAKIVFAEEGCGQCSSCGQYQNLTI
jgi:hypothetical protein